LPRWLSRLDQDGGLDCVEPQDGVILEAVDHRLSQADLEELLIPCLSEKLLRSISAASENPLVAVIDEVEPEG